MNPDPENAPATAPALRDIGDLDGPRICPCRYLALLEMKMAMAMLLSRFDIVSVDTPNGAEAQECMAFTMAPLGLSMRLRERV